MEENDSKKDKSKDTSKTRSNDKSTDGKKDKEVKPAYDRQNFNKDKTAL